MSKKKHNIKFSFEDKEAYGIEISNLIKIYEDPSSDEGILALRGIELKVKPSDFISIIGPSGSGKSTLLNIIGGITRPNAGTVFANHLPIHSLQNYELEEYRRKVVGFMWQLPEQNLLPGLSAEENIEYSHNIAGYPKSKRKERVNELLKAVGLVGRRKSKLGQLSGGEAQRASLAVALANEPRILCADEPTGELDNDTTEVVTGFLKDINKDFGTTMIIVTHDPRFKLISQKTFGIFDGQIAGVERARKIKEINQDKESNSRGNKQFSWHQYELEQLSAVDKHGNVKIPSEILKQAGIDEYVRIYYKDGKVILESASEE